MKFFKIDAKSCKLDIKIMFHCNIKFDRLVAEDYIWLDANDS